MSDYIFITTGLKEISNASVHSVCGEGMKKFIESHRFVGYIKRRYPAYLTVKVEDLWKSLEAWLPSFTDKWERLYLLDQLKRIDLASEEEISVGPFP